MEYDVIIAGAGPVGLSLALRLAQEGKHVLVLEKNQTTHEHSRAPAIWPRTQEILADLNVMEKFLERGIVLRHLTLRDAATKKALLELPLEELNHETDYPHLLILPQSQTEKLLCEAVKETCCARLRFGSELIGIEQNASSVRVQYKHGDVTEAVTALYLVGCDGAHSTVRELLEFRLEGKTYAMQAALADVELETDSPFPLLTTGEVLAVIIKIDAKLWRLILPFAKNDNLPLNERTAKAMAQLFPGQPYREIWSSEFRLHNRISTRFVQGRIALAGDAAHINSPVGGQGMNAGILDTEVLGKALLEALEQNDSSVLQRYERERKAAIGSGVNRFTDILTQAILIGQGRFLKVIVQGWNLCLRIPFIRRRFVKRMAMLE